MGRVVTPMGYTNRGQLLSRTCQTVPTRRDMPRSGTDGLIRLSGRNPRRAEGHPINHHVARHTGCLKAIGKSGCPPDPHIRFAQR